MFFSQTTGGFYASEIHGDNIPSDAVEITADEHRALLEGQSQGKVILTDKKGKPVLADPAPPTAAELLAQRKVEAQAYLDSTDWYLARKVETGADVPADVLENRAAARATMNEV